jgi:hypothetical protein
MPITAAVTAGIGAAGSIGSSLIGANASKNAAAQQVAAQQQALAQQQSMFNTAQNTLNPFIQYGQGNISTLNSLLQPGSSAAALAQMPGFQFQSQYGTKAATNALAARGQGASAGPLATAISQYNNGLAGTQYFNTVSALQNAVNTGANSANALAGYAINSGNSQANTLGNVGNAQAAGTLGSANALSSGITGASGAVNNALLFSALGGGGGVSGLYSSPSYGGNILTGAYGGSASNPLPGLTAEDYG